MTIDEARLMANVNDRAGRLFEAGYRACWTSTASLKIRTANGTTYLVDAGTGACDCPFYRAHQGRHPCKHSLGWRLLLSKQRACRRLITLVLMRTWADLDDADPRSREADVITGADETDAREAEASEVARERETAHAA